MTLPSFLFGMLIATLFGAVFHFWKRGSFGRLLLYILLSWLGFWAGHFIANRLNLSFDSLGPIHLGAAVAGSILFLLVGYWLSLVEVEKE
jgi:uncharacterized membrane protein YeaQ/YmgE (transglycosylase-associated protein family)